MDSSQPHADDELDPDAQPPAHESQPIASTPLAFVTPDSPGIGGIIKQRETDFLVEELPLYETSGTGEHLYLCVEKRNATTRDVVRRLAKLFNVRRSSIGFAGLKDRHAVTRQHFSIHLPGKEKLDTATLEQFKHLPYGLLWAHRHNNKLQRGHLAGNRFIINVRDTPISSVIAAKKTLDHLQRVGVPNYLGPQRFGYRGDNNRLGALLLKRDFQAFLDLFLGSPLPHESRDAFDARAAFEAGDLATALSLWPRRLPFHRQALDLLRQGKTAEQTVRAIEQDHRNFLVSATQGSIFNRTLDRRVREGLLTTLLPGDLAFKHDNGAVFAVDPDTAATENAAEGRVAKLEVSPSGPMWGPKMTRASELVDQSELQALHDEGLTLDDLAHDDALALAPGLRRSMRVSVTDAEVSAGADEHGPFIRAAFTLPRGAFATVVMRELMKNEHAAAAEESAVQ